MKLIPIVAILFLTACSEDAALRDCLLTVQAQETNIKFLSNQLHPLPNE